MLFRSFLLLFLAVLPQPGAGDKAFVIIEDLTPRFASQLEAGSTKKAVHTVLDLSQAHGNYLLIESARDFYVFVNSEFALRGRNHVKLSADSLARKFSSSVFISVYQREGTADLSVKWIALTPPDAMYNPKRPAITFSNFLLVASLILILFFTALFRTNPQLTLDYLNVGKLFYFRDREENQITLRITSSVNLLFYLFCGLLASLALIIATHFSNQAFLPTSYSSQTIGQFSVQWILLALAILGLLMAKLAFASLLGLMYGWDVAGFQFFNFVRVLILSLVLIAAISVFCFSFQIDVNYYGLLKMGCLLMIAGAGLLYFKLQNRTSFRSFHLFSYLCATEIFPLVILVKVLLF